MCTLGAILSLLCRTSCRRRRKLFVAKPSLQSARIGKLVIGIQRVQLQQQSPGAPSGMLLAQFQGAPANLGVVGRSAHAAGLVRRLQRLLAVCANFAEQATNGAQRDLEFLGDLTVGLPRLGTVPNRFANGWGKSAWHGRVLSIA
jgi:hypothetical protein